MFINTYAYLSFNDEPGDNDEDINNAANAAAAGSSDADDKPSPFRQGVEKANGLTDDGEVIVEQDAPVPPSGDDVTDPAAKPDGEEEDDDGGADEKAEADSKFQADLDKEVAELGLKGKTEERFRSMSTKLREKDEELAEYAAIKDELPQLRKAAESAATWEDALAATGADQAMFGRTMGYLYAINNGTREEKIDALKGLDTERAWLAEQIGIKVEGAYNPLDKHEDLKKRVESGDLDEKDALDLIEAREIKAGTSKKTSADQAASDLATERTEALTAVGAWQEQAKKDPHFNTKAKMLAPTIGLIRENLPPKQWAGKIKEAYDAIVLAPINKPKPPVSRPSVRPGASTNQTEKPTVANAFRFGVDKAKSAGR